MIAYYATTKEHGGWEQAWAKRSLSAEVESLRGTPLRALVFSLLPRLLGDQLVLDAGCGIGAWVALLMERGYRLVGVDDAAQPPSSLPIYRARLENLWMLKDGDVDVYLSLGVIEHEELGPDKILREAARVLARGGTALVSVPYVNGLRTCLRGFIRIRQAIKHPATFYQWAFTKRELTKALARHGLLVQSSHPYGPTKMFRTWFRESTRDRYDAGSAARSASPSLLRRAIRWLLYTRPMLRLCGHMLLVVAVKK